MSSTLNDLQAVMVRGMFAVNMKQTQFDSFNGSWGDLPEQTRVEWATITRNIFNMIRGKDTDDAITRYIEKNVRGSRIIDIGRLLVFLKRAYVIAHSSKSIA